MTTFHAMQSALAMTLLHSLWQVALLSVLAASVLALLERRSAALRHGVGMGFLLLMAAAPLATFAWLVDAPVASSGPVANGSWTALAATPAFDIALGSSIAAPTWFAWLWCAGVLVMLARLLGGWRMVQSLDRQAFSPLPDDWARRAETLRRALGIRRQVAVRLLHGLGLPCSARAWRPVVWLPVSILTRLDPDQIEALIAHELAHVSRLDWIWNGLQCAVESLLFFHPGMWWLSRRIRHAREEACDDLAVAVCGDAIVLAEALATLERHRMPTHALVLSATGGPLMKRITRLLSPDQPASKAARLRWAIPMGLMAAICSGALLAAQLHAPRPAVPAQSPVVVAQADTALPAPPPPPAAPPAPPAPASDAPPAPPAPPAPAPAAALPAPPPPPAPPSLTTTAAYQSALRAAQHDAGVIAKVGSPVRGGEPVRDSWLTDTRADLTFPVTGPDGTVLVRVHGDRQAGGWNVATLNLLGD